MRHKPTAHEVEHVKGQIATFSCGITGCRFTMTTRLDTWLRVREAHRAEAHPTFTPRKLRGRKTPPRTFTEREMREGVAA